MELESIDHSIFDLHQDILEAFPRIWINDWQQSAQGVQNY